MHPLGIVVTILCCALTPLLTGCDRTDRAASLTVQEDIYAEKSAKVTPSVTLVESVVNDVGGNITIIAADNGLVDGDFVETGTGADAESARNEAQAHMAASNDPGSSRIQRRNDARQPIDQRDHAWVHLRVPPGTNLPDVRTQSGNIDIHGAVGDVRAVISGTGNIDVMGGTGDVDLTTGRGSIRIDLTAPGEINARANQGNIEIIAENAVVTATNAGGNVRFIGSLRSNRTHSLETTAGGNIAVAISNEPVMTSDNVVLRIRASTTAQPIITDYPSAQKDGVTALAICGVIHNIGPYDYHVEHTDFHFGRLEVGSSPTTTHFFTGTLTNTYYRFETNQPHLSLFTPRAQAIHIFTADEYAQIAAGKIPVDADCAEALKSNLDQKPAIEVSLRSGSGRIFFHFIDRQP